jgi:hypothetical protein
MLPLFWRLRGQPGRVTVEAIDGGSSLFQPSDFIPSMDISIFIFPFQHSKKETLYSTLKGNIVFNTSTILISQRCID